MEIRFGPERPAVHVEQITVEQGKVLVGEMLHDMQGGVNLPHDVAIEAAAWLQIPGRSVYYLTAEGKITLRGMRIAGKEVQSASNGYIGAATEDPFLPDTVGKYMNIPRDIPTKKEIIILLPAPGEKIEVY